MTALALPRPRLWLPTFEPWRLLRPIINKMEGQFQPGQRLQFESGDIGPAVLQMGMTELAFLTSASSSGPTITIPGAAQEGDIAVLADGAIEGSGPSPTKVVPAGWSEWGSSTSLGDGMLVISYKILVEGDAGSSISGMNDDFEDKVMGVWRGNVAATTIVPSVLNIDKTAGNPSAQSVTASGGDVPLIVIGVVWADSATAAFSTASPSFDNTIANSQNDILLGEKTYNASPQNHTIDMNSLAAMNGLASGYLQVS